MIPTARHSVVMFAAMLAALVFQSPLAGQDATDRPYGAIQAGYDAYRFAEERRREALHRQLETIDWINWSRGRPYDGVGVYYRRPVSRSDLYAYGVGPELTENAPANVFLPWPYVPGDIWGFPNDATVRQPIDQRQIQTGPGRWESHPIYAEPPVLAKPEPVDSPRAKSGPREF